MKAQKTVPLMVLISLLLISGVYAYSVTSNGVTTEVNAPSDNFIGRIISFIQYNLFKMGDFTAYGDTLGCSKNPNDIITFKGTGTFDLNKYSQDSAFVDWFRGSPHDGAYSTHLTDSRQFLDEVYLEKGKVSSTSFSCDASAYWNNECYGEIYYCPKPCYSNSDCGLNEQCDKSVLSSKIPNAGVCKETSSSGGIINPTHKTNVYSCSNGNKTFINSVSYGNLNFCSSPSDSKYLIGNTDQCLATEPSICNTKIINENVTLKSISLTEGEWNSATPKLTAASMCELGSDCVPRENYSTSCIFSEDIKNINKNAISTLSQAEGGITAVCFGVEDSIFGISKILFGENFGCVNFDYKDYNLAGTCRAEPVGGDFFKSLAFFDVDGNGKKDATDGMIILFGGIILLFLVMSMGGKK